MYGLDSSVSSTAPLEIVATSHPSGITRLTSYRGSWVEADSEALLGGILKVTDTNVNMENHPIARWILSGVTLPGSGVVSSNVDSSDGASTLTCAVSDGALTITSDVGLVYSVDVKACGLAIARAANRAMRNWHDTTAESWRTFYNLLRGAWWE